MVFFLIGVLRVDLAVDKIWFELDDGVVVEIVGFVVDLGLFVILGLLVLELNRVYYKKKKGLEKDILYIIIIKKN